MKAIAVFTLSMGPKMSKLAGIDHCGAQRYARIDTCGESGGMHATAVAQSAIRLTIHGPYLLTPMQNNSILDKHLHGLKLY